MDGGLITVTSQSKCIAASVLNPEFDPDQLATAIEALGET